MYRYFKCNKLGGFRLIDFNRKVCTDEYLYFETHICETSQSVKAALNLKWMLEVSSEEAAKHIQIPETKVQKAEVESKKEEVKVQRGSKPRQPMQKQKEEDKPAIPNFNEAEKKMRERQADISTKGADEVLPSPIQIKKQSNKEKIEDVLINDLSKEVEDIPEGTEVMPDFNEKIEVVEEKKEVKKNSRRKKSSK